MSNFTVIGPNDGAVSADYGWNMRWRRGCKFVLANSIVLGGQKGGLRLQEDSTIAYYLRGQSAFYNSFLGAVTNDIDVQTGLTIPDETYDAASIQALTTGDYKSVIVDAPADIKLTDPFNNGAPDLSLDGTSPAATGALFDFGSLTDGFFEQVSYRGAFGTENWTTGWTVWGL
jgi:hypothetical protein